jgi:hypothetical protein
MSYLNPDDSLISYFFRTNFNIIPPCRSPAFRIDCRVYLCHLKPSVYSSDFIILMIHDEQCNFLHSRLISPSLHPNILRNTISSSTLNRCSAPSAKKSFTSVIKQAKLQFRISEFLSFCCYQPKVHSNPRSTRT